MSATTSTTADLFGSAASSANAVRAMACEHLGVQDGDLDELPNVAAKFVQWRQISVHAALASFLDEQPEAGLYGVAVPLRSFVTPNMAELLITPNLRLGPVDYVTLPNGADTTMACLNSGFITGHWDGHPFVAWVHVFREDANERARWFAVEVKCGSNDAATAFLAEIRERMVVLDPYKGNSLRLEIDRAGDIINIHFEPRPIVTRDQVILRDGALESAEEHAVGVGQSAARLRAAGQHLKRGLLLYGPPGTGKTHTIRYLTSQMPEATLFILTGGEMGKIKVISEVLADFAPAVVVFDDVDLIAEDRDSAGNAGSTLFNLLDAMDGVAEDVDVLFICTTNRVETLEGAIASRPGRIDQAVEVGVPNADCRNQLLRLYSKGLTLEVKDPFSVVDRTKGVTASFIKELMRRAALISLEESGDLVDDDRPVMVNDAHLSGALDILLDPSQPLTKSLLGVHEDIDVSELERQKVRGSGQAWCGI